jgi:hypothetical protein
VCVIWSDGVFNSAAKLNQSVRTERDRVCRLSILRQNWVLTFLTEWRSMASWWLYEYLNMEYITSRCSSYPSCFTSGTSKNWLCVSDPVNPIEAFIIIIIIIIINVVSCHRPFLPGASLEPAVIPTAQTSSFTLQWIYYYYYYYYVISCHRPFLPGTSLEPAVIPTAQNSSFTLQWIYYYYYYYYY